MSEQKKKYWLNAEIVEPGDIVLTRDQERISQKIRVVTNGNYSHAMLYLGNYSLLEAYAPEKRVRSQNIQRLHFDDITSCLVLRMKEDFDYVDAQNVVDSARTKVGTLYSSLSEIKKLRAKVEHSALEPNRQFCSRLVAQSYQEAGFKIVDNPDYCSPADFERSRNLEVVTGALCEMSEEQLEIFSQPVRSLDEMETTTDKLLFDAMEVAGEDIQNLNALTDYIIKNPQHDDAIANTTKASGYLSVWRLDMEENPELYSVAEFESKYPNEILRFEAAEHQLAIEDSIVFHQRVTFDSFYRLNQEWPGKYFELLIENYKKLEELSNTRKAVATKILNSISGIL